MCHGDLHPFNVLDDDGPLVVLDWTGAVVADPCFDLALTELLLANPPLVLPGPGSGRPRPAGSSPGGSSPPTPAPTPASPDHLPWFRALHGARVLIE